MRIVSFERDGARTGLLSCRGVHELAAVLAGARIPAEIASAADPGELELVGLHAHGEVSLLTPVRPTVLVGVDDNYADQPRLRRAGLAAQRVAALEAVRARGPADDAWIFLRDPASIIAPPGPVRKPAGCERLSCGVSLAVAIGRPAYQVSAADAAAHIAGLTVVLDVARCDLPPGHAALARSHPTHTPIGPALVTLGEAPLDVERHLSLSVNGEVRQAASTADMLVHPASLVEAVSRRLPLAPGDVLLTGTPGGTAEDLGEGWLQAGDLVVAEVEGVGRLEIVVAGES